MKHPALQKTNQTHGGVQELYFFKNGYGASVVRHSFSYGNKKGLWELAVLTGNTDDFELCYKTPITQNVIGHQTEEEVLDILYQIEALASCENNEAS